MRLSRNATLGTFRTVKMMILKGLEAGTINADYLNCLEERTGVFDCPMTIQNWEAVNATLLWINLKTGILPHSAAILPVRDNNR
jgi:hypothetical protein